MEVCTVGFDYCKACRRHIEDFVRRRVEVRVDLYDYRKACWRLVEVCIVGFDYFAVAKTDSPKLYKPPTRFALSRIPEHSLGLYLHRTPHVISGVICK